MKPCMLTPHSPCRCAGGAYVSVSCLGCNEGSRVDITVDSRRDRAAQGLHEAIQHVSHDDPLTTCLVFQLCDLSAFGVLDRPYRHVSIIRNINTKPWAVMFDKQT